MSIEQFNSYQSFFSYLRKQKLAVQISNDLQTFFQRILPILSNTMTNNQYNSSYQRQLENQFKRLEYPFMKAEGPICSKNIQKFFSCYDCTKNNKYNATTSICVDCFQIENHQGHNFRFIETTLAVCDCGDAQSLYQQCFCSRHRNKKGQQPTICSKVQDTFIKQMQFNIFIFLSMIRIKAVYTDDHKKKEIFGLTILKKINEFIGKSYSNKIIATNLFASKLNPIFPILSDEDQESSIIHLLSKQLSFSVFNQKLSQLILPLYSVKKMRGLVIEQIFKFITSCKCFFEEKNVLGKVIFQYFHALSILQQQLQLHNPLVINYVFQSIAQRYKGYICFFKVYYYLITCPNQITIVQLLLSNMNITQLTQYYVPKMQKTNKEEFYNLQLHYFKVISKMIQVIVQSTHKEQLLVKIIKDCYCQIKNKDNSPSLSVQRTFSLAYFAYIDFDLSNIFDFDNEAILQFFDQQDEYALIERINEIIKKSFTALKLQNFSQFKKIMQRKDLAFQPGPIGVDHTYTKIMINLLFKLGHQNDQDFKPLDCYINSRRHSLEVLFNLFKEQQIAKLEQTISSIFLQISNILNYFVFLSETYIYELMVTNWLSPSKVKKHQIFQLFQFLAYIYDPSSIKQLKETAQKYIKSDYLMEQYVRHYYDNHKREFSKRIPNNNFNLSYTSTYVYFKSFKEDNSMYYLKLKKYRRTEISRLIFNQSMISQIIDLFSNIFHMYSSYFKFNQIPMSKNIIVTALETLILLALQTKNQVFDQIISTIIQSDYIQAISSQYSKHIIQMYTQNKEKVKQEKKSEPKELIHIQPNKRAKEKLAQKMNLIKNQQQKILSKNSASLVQSQHHQDTLCCIICKQHKKSQRLYYLSHTRFSNVAKTCKNSKKQKKVDPILVISTCGHTAHLLCLKKSLSIEDLLSQMLQFACFLCKGYSNSLFPVVTTQSHQNHEQIEHYLSKYAAFILELMQRNRELGKKINYQSFNLKELIFQSICQCIYWYGLYFPKYLITKILPIVCQAILIFRFSGKVQQQFKFISNESFRHSWINFIRKNLLYIIENSGQQLEIQSKIRGQFNLFVQTNFIGLKKKEDLDRLFIIFMELSSSKPINFYQIVLKHTIKDSFHELFSLPQDLLDLNKEIGKCPTCKKPTSKIVVCFFCSFKTCEQCQDQILKHISYHFASCIFIRAQLGDLYYCLEDDRLRIQSLYRNYAGDYLQNAQVFPQKQKYLLSHEKRHILYEIGLDDVIKYQLVGSHSQNVCLIQ